MTANELRIGNWVNYKGEPIPVTMVGQYGIQSKTEEALINAKFSTPDISPIPLTPEILVACGCSGNYPYNLKINDRWNIEFRLSSQPYDRCFLYSLDGFGEMSVPWLVLPHIQFLHQLQNLYYCLTNQELKYQP